MRRRSLPRPLAGACAVALVTPAFIVATATSAQASTASSIVAAAESQLFSGSRTGPGPCGLSGDGYYATDTGQADSCSDGDYAHAWCADFAGWVWQQAGAAGLGDLNDLAQSFYEYGKNNGTRSDTPAVGDAVYYHPDSEPLSNTGDDHVAIVVAVNDDGTIDTIGGNEGPGEGAVHEDIGMPGSVGAAEWAGADGNEVNLYAFIAPVGATPADDS
jgi:hypothetical protein